MEFRKYQHVERLGSAEVDGILNGNVYIFPKLDGTNTTVYLDKGKIKVGSRNRELTLNHDNAGAFKYITNDLADKLMAFFKVFPSYRLFGEWLIPHTLRTYNEDAWRHFYIFDVVHDFDADREVVYLPYEEYQPLLEIAGLDYIPPLAKLQNPTVQEVQSCLDKNTYLMKPGEIGEGIVIKNYGFVNTFGHTTWAKIVRPVNKVAIKMKRPLTGGEIEPLIVEKFVTPELVEKEFAKLVNDNGGFENKLIGKFLGAFWYTFITEEIFNILRKFKNPKIDFALLNQLTVQKIKDVKSEVFTR